MKTKFPRADALAVARELNGLLTPHCDRLIFAGSLRRRKAEVGDVEILYIPRIGQAVDPSDLFGAKADSDFSEIRIAELLASGVLTKRPNVKGGTAWGEKNKLAIHAASGIPVDLFSASRLNWHNYLVCRTGGADSNMEIASAAKAKGWTWNPYGVGFSKTREALRKTIIDVHPMHSEREVFEFVKLPFLEPWERA